MTLQSRLLVFDWDGTLADSIARIVGCFEAALRDIEEGPLPASALRAVIGLGLDDIAPVLLPGRSEDVFRRFVEAYRDHWLAPEAPKARLFEGADATVRELRNRGYRLVVATGKSRRGLDRELVETGLGDVFEGSRCADETRSKPHPQMLEELLSVTNTRPADALMIGDTGHDLEMARAAGVASIAVGYGVQPLAELREYGPAHCVDQITELLRVL